MPEEIVPCVLLPVSEELVVVAEDDVLCGVEALAAVDCGDVGAAEEEPPHPNALKTQKAAINEAAILSFTLTPSGLVSSP